MEDRLDFIKVRGENREEISIFLGSEASVLNL